MADERYYVGEDLKFQITLTAEGFDQASDKYNIDFYCGKQEKHFTEADIIPGTEGFFLLIPTSGMQPGMMKLIVTVFIPDEHFASGFRKEVESISLGMLRPLL